MLNEQSTINFNHKNSDIYFLPNANINFVQSITNILKINQQYIKKRHNI